MTNANCEDTFSVDHLRLRSREMKPVFFILTYMVYKFASASKSSNPCDGDPVVFIPETFEQDMDNRECDEMFHQNPSKTTYYGGYNTGGSITTRCNLISKTCKRTCKAGPSCGCGNTYGLSKARDVCITLGASYGVIEGSAQLCYQFQQSFQCKSGDCERCKFYACAKTATTKWQCSTYITGSNKINKNIVTKTNASIEGYVDRCEKDGTCATECCDKTNQPTSFPTESPKMSNLTKVINGQTLQDVSVATSKFDFSSSSLMGTCQHILTMKEDATVSNGTKLVSNTLVYTNGEKISASFQAEDVDCSQVLQPKNKSQVLQPKNKPGIFDLLGFNFRH